MPELRKSVLRVAGLSAALLLSLGVARALSGQASTREVLIETSDGIVLTGDLLWTEETRGRPFLLLFHQGGSNARAEYGSMIARLSAEGFNLLAVDQRRGGDRFGGVNRTVERLGDREFTFCEAYADLEATLAYARELEPSVWPVIWGSSFSAALAIQLAAGHADEVSRVLAFSPASGDPMAGCEPGAYVEDLAVPALFLRPASEMEIPRVAAQLETFQEQGHQTYVADPGVHGSSMLNPERVEGDVEPTWAVVLRFLRGENQ
jgi:pimeloyl-ACP methyl ester carboxylesterase